MRYFVIHKYLLAVSDNDSSINVLVDNADIYAVKKHTRSKVECATYCYADRSKCWTAVYQQDGDCLLITNLTNSLTINDNGLHTSSEHVIAMRGHVSAASKF